MKAFNPYLNFPGNTEEAFLFYRSVFGGEFSVLQRFSDTPEAGNVLRRTATRSCISPCRSRTERC